MSTVEGEARRALARLRRSIEKADAGLGAVEAVLRHAEGDDFPAAAFAESARHLRAVADFVDEQAERLEAKILHAGGIEPGRVRRTGGL